MGALRGSKSMSGYKVIHAVDETLRHLLWSAMKIDPTISDPNILGSSDDKRISLEPPFRLIHDTEPDNNYLSLFLYRIMENPEMKNRPLEQNNGNRLQYPPLSLNLFYLVTPLIKGQNSSENAHKLLSKAMQIFYDNAIVTGVAIQGSPPDKPEELRIILNPISLEDITKLWSSFMRPYHLSVSYEVKVIYIDSERETEAEQVRRKHIEFKHIAKT
jgi:Pvc16 N-terminal domain